MADDQVTSGEETQDPADLNSQDQDTPDQPSGHESKTVSHKTYKQTVAEAKAMRTKARELELKLKSLEDERLEATGAKDELIKRLKSQLDGETKKTKDLYGTFARKSLSAQLKGAAVEAGCIDPDAVMSLADLTDVDVSTDTFEADPDQIKDVINTLKKSKPYLFNKQAPKINAKLPGGGRVDGSIDFGSMTTDQIQATLRQLSGIK